MVKKRSWRMFTIVAAAVIIVVPAIFLLLTGTSLGLSSVITSGYIILIPSLMLFFFGMLALVMTRGVYSLAAMLMVGIGLSIMFKSMDTLGLITVDMLAGLSVEQLGLWVIILSGLVGSIIAALTTSK